MTRFLAWLSWLSVVGLSATVCQAGDSDETNRIAISGQVFDENSQGVAGVAVRGVAYTDITEATTDEDGRFVLDVIAERVRQLTIVAEDDARERIGSYKAPWDDPPNEETPIEIRLGACRRLPVVVIDANGEPAADVRVGAIINFDALTSVVTDASGKAELTLPVDAEVQSLYASKPGVGFDYRVVTTPRDDAHVAEWFDDPPIQFQLAESQTLRIRLLDADDNPIAATDVYLWLLNKPGEPDSFNLGDTPKLFHVTTDETGLAEFHGVPTWDVHPLTFWPSTENYTRDRIRFDPAEHPDGLLTVKLDRLVTVTGRVRFADGRAAADIGLTAVGAGYKFDGFREQVTTDEDGQFELRVAPDLLYMFAVQDQEWAAPVIDALVIRPDEPVTELEFELRPTTRVHGRVTVGPDEQPVVGQRMSLRQAGRDLHNLEGAKLPNPEGSRRWVQPAIYRSAVTDEQGRYEFFIGPGQFTLSGPSQVEPQKFDVVDESEFAFDFASPRPESGPFTGMVVTGDPPEPVAGATLEGIYRAGAAGRDLRLRTDGQGRFAGERQLHTVVIRAESPDGRQAGIVEVGPDDSDVTISIAPLASTRARLIDAPTGEPLPDTEIRWGRRVHIGDDDAPWRTAWGGSTTTDPAGYFQTTGLVVGQQYSFSVPRGDGTYGALPGFTPETSTTTDLGDLRLEPPYEPPTLEERIERELAVRRPFEQRYNEALEQAGRLRQHLLVLFVDRETAVTSSWFELRFDDGQVRSALPNYQLLHVAVDADGAAELADRLAVEMDPSRLPIWRFSNALGEELETGEIPRLAESDDVDRVAVLERLARHAPEPLDARKLMKDALAKAAVSNRRVIVQETATWCGPCHLLARFLERHRSLWEKDYLWVRIDQRWHGSDEVMNEIKQGYRGGIPWVAILDSDAQVLATSDGPDGNIGFPSEQQGIDHFIEMIETTMQRMTETEVAALRTDLESR